MRALYFDKTLSLRNLPDPVPGPGECLIAIDLVGICNTDLEIMKGYMAFEGVLGHEFVGHVIQCDDASWAGKRVIGEINFGCGQCAFCHAGMARHCQSRSVMGIAGKQGAMADKLTLPLGNCIEVSGSISDEAAVLTEPLAAACEILEQLHLEPMHRVAVLGDGKLGSLVALVLNTTAADITVFGHHENRCRFLMKQGVRAHWTEQAAASSYDVVIDATGSELGLKQALTAARPRGTVVLKTTVAQGYQIDLAPLVINEQTLLGSRCGRFEPALRLLEKNLFDITGLVETIYPAGRWQEAFEHAQQRGTGKVLLDFRDRTNDR